MDNVTLNRLDVFLDLLHYIVGAGALITRDFSVHHLSCAMCELIQTLLEVQIICPFRFDDKVKPSLE